jgi:hypothetical protein
MVATCRKSRVSCPFEDSVLHHEVRDDLLLVAIESQRRRLANDPRRPEEFFTHLPRRLRSRSGGLDNPNVPRDVDENGT